MLLFLFWTTEVNLNHYNALKTFHNFKRLIRNHLVRWGKMNKMRFWLT